MTKCAVTILVLACGILIGSWTTLDACSVFSVTAKDKTIISGRTMEFGHDMGYAMIVVPRGKSFVSPAPEGVPPAKWITQYGYVANNVLGKEDGISDGLNEVGLSFSLLWYDGNMQWQKVSPQGQDAGTGQCCFRILDPGKFRQRQGSGASRGQGERFRAQKSGIGRSGASGHSFYTTHPENCAVIEYEQGLYLFTTNPLGIMTNAPNFPWMLTNLRNYVGNEQRSALPCGLRREDLSATGHGAGMFGLPGDLTPPSRFVRMAVMLKFADPQENAEGLLNLAQHIVSALHIVRGMAVDRDANGKITASESTQWSSFRDLTNRVYYYRTYDNLTCGESTSKSSTSGQTESKTIPMFVDGKEWWMSRTGE
jgi:choloylglycine hydrolase